MNDILKILNLSIQLKHSNQKPIKIINNINFSLKKNNVLALVGENGSGKSTIALSILRLLPECFSIKNNSMIIFDKEDLLKVSEERIREIRKRKISIIFQESSLSLNPIQTIEKQIGEIFILNETPYTRNQKKIIIEKVRNNVIKMLELVGFKNAENKLNNYPFQLSGGQCQRVMIAMALARNPDLLIADEPTSSLDSINQLEILNLLKSLQRKFSMSLLLISHNLKLVNNVADHIAIIKNGKILEYSQADIINKCQKKNPYTKRLISYTYHDKKVFSHDSILDKKVFFCKNLNISFYNQSFFNKKATFLLKNISFSLSSRETLGIVGESGSGKTSIAYALLKLLPSSGEIWFKGIPIHLLKEKEFRSIRNKLQIIFQDPISSLNSRLSVAQIISEGLRVHYNLSRREIEFKVNSIIKEVGLNPLYKDCYPYEFSGGQCQRIAIARSLILKPEVLILDEPTASLDKISQFKLINLLLKLQKKYDLSYIFISHNLDLIRAIAHKILVINDGSIIEYGDTEKVFKFPTNPYTRKLIESSL